MTVKGGTGAIIEYFGEGAESISATGKGTICNMGAEVGATTSNFAYDDAMERYLKATGREKVAQLANEIRQYLRSDPEVYDEPERFYDQLIEINLDELEPHLNGPFTPDLDTPLSRMKERLHQHDWPRQVEWGLIGSCTNSSYEDLSRAASIAKQAIEKKIPLRSKLGINPGSEQVRYTAERDGILDVFEQLGARIFTKPNRVKTPSSTHSIATSLSATTATPIHTPSWPRPISSWHSPWPADWTLTHEPTPYSTKTAKKCDWIHHRAKNYLHTALK